MKLLNYKCSARDHFDRFRHFFRFSLDKVTNNGNTKMIQTSAIMIFALILGNANTTWAGESMKLNENDSGKTVEILVGDNLEVILQGNPTTGYVWEVGSLDSAVLRLDNSDLVVGDKAIGSGGMEIIKIRAIAPGTGAVRLIYHRIFEPNKPPKKTFSITAVVKNK